MFVRIRHNWKNLKHACQNPTDLTSNINHGYFLYLKMPLFDHFNSMLEKWYFWRSYLPLKCSFSVHFNEITTQMFSMKWKILSFSLILMVPIIKLHYQNHGFLHTMFHPLPDFYKHLHLIPPIFLSFALFFHIFTFCCPFVIYDSEPCLPVEHDTRLAVQNRLVFRI